MGSVKDLIMGDSSGGKLYIPPSVVEFGLGAWRVSGRYSVKDLKKIIPESDIKNKAAALTMQTAAFFEWLANKNPFIPTCYMGILDKDGKITDVQKLLQRGETSDTIVMKLAHVPESYIKGDMKDSQRLALYREALVSGELQCGVADVESIFRKGFPLGSSTFEKIFKAVGMEKEYETMATYNETVVGLDKIREKVREKSLSSFPKLEEVLREAKLGEIIPNPGFVLEGIDYDSTSKFEKSGDRPLTKKEERIYSGLSDGGYKKWTEDIFPTVAQAQIDFCNERGILNIDGKGECVAYRKQPVITDFMCGVDENRLMIIVNIDGVDWAIPSNKEIQRAIFKKERVDVAKSYAKELAVKGRGDENLWPDYMERALQEHKIDIRAVSEHSCELMGHAVAEVTNRLLGKKVFDTEPIDTWARDFVPYASKIEMQK